MTDYVVWRRNDGYVGCTTNHLPQDWKTPTGMVTFVQLRTFPEWNNECVDFIVEQSQQ